MLIKRQGRVIGLDLSLTKTGVARVDGSTYTIKTKESEKDRRLIHIQNEIRLLLETSGHVDMVVIEDVLTHGAYAIHTLGMVHGVVRMPLMERQIPYVLVNAGTLKAFATGKGGANKTEMTMAAYKRAGVEFGDDNQCDAWWLRAAGLDRLGTPEVTLPKAQCDRLDVAKWPAVTISA